MCDANPMPLHTHLGPCCKVRYSAEPGVGCTMDSRPAAMLYTLLASCVTWAAAGACIRAKVHSSWHPTAMTCRKRCLWSVLTTEAASCWLTSCSTQVRWLSRASRTASRHSPSSAMRRPGSSTGAPAAPAACQKRQAKQPTSHRDTVIA